MADAKFVVLSLNNPKAVLQLEHNNPLTIPVLWSWSTLAMMSGSLHISHRPPDDLTIASNWSFVKPYLRLMSWYLSDVWQRHLLLSDRSLTDTPGPHTEHVAMRCTGSISVSLWMTNSHTPDRHFLNQDNHLHSLALHVPIMTSHNYIINIVKYLINAIQCIFQLSCLWFTHLDLHP